MAAALDGIVVLDLSRVLAGPWCGQVLADLGATVVKVERPGAGDDTRAWGPPFLKDRDGDDTTEAAYYLAANRGKRSITLDIATDGGARIARELAAKADIAIENFKLGGLAKYGLDYESLKALNPALIYCSITRLRPDRALRPPGRLRLRAPGFLRLHVGHRASATTVPAAGRRRRAWRSPTSRRASTAPSRSSPLSTTATTRARDSISTWRSPTAPSRSWPT